MKLKNFYFLFILVFLLTACGTTGKDFSAGFVKNIEKGKTTKQELIQEIGERNRKGMTDGDEWWIYEYNTYKLGKSFSKDLSIRFDNSGVVKTYNFSSNFPGEAAR